MKLAVPRFGLWGYIAVAALLAGSAAGWKFGSGHYQKLYEREISANWKEKAQDEEVARKAVESQLTTLRETLANNERVKHDLEQHNQAIAADSDRIRGQLRRLRLHSSSACAAGDRVPEASSGSTATRPSGDAGDDGFSEVAGDALAECRRNSARLDALSAQIKPQL